jgi:hypothetical protein
MSTDVMELDADVGATDEFASLDDFETGGSFPRGRAARPLPQAAKLNGTQRKSLLFFDLETVPDYSRLASFGLDPLPEPKPETGVSDCPKIDDFLKLALDQIGDELKRINPCDAWLDLLSDAERKRDKPRSGLTKAVDGVRSERLSIVQAAESRRKLLSVTPEYCRIAAMGWAFADGDQPQSIVAVDPDFQAQEILERKLLESFWEMAASCERIVGFNVIGFDLPVIFVRSMLLGITATRRIDLRPWGGDVVDLMERRFAKSKAMKLKELARLYGMQIPAGDVDGSQVAELAEVDPAKLDEYVKSDVTITRELFRLYEGYFC